ncbi:glutamate-cysteine ligase family protein [Alteromonas flava]|uniref:glutamate-cysteine ligase family protein n=1 Tax=Alteromonas flava TaxID=2048003 RepID=UPI000C2935ED|nr:glutamate-cysteine ligase family protein [Alteromonas flava]
MGQSIHHQAFAQEHYQAFHRRLETELALLKPLLTDSQFDKSAPSLGAELEMYLVDNQWLPKPCNQWLLDQRNSDLVQPELNQYNLEFNLAPVSTQDRALTALHDQLEEELAALRSIAYTSDTQIVPIGVLPTLDERHLSREFLTNRPRYHALSEQLNQLKGSAFDVDINGLDSLKMRTNEVTLEGANTSFQVHLRVQSSRFTELFNAAQLVTPLALALAANSPLLMGKRLWHETRIALFKQSIDSRNHDSTRWRQPARVNFGHGWLRQSVLEIFAENIALYPALLPQLPDDSPPDAFKAIQMHQGTIWSWNRPVLDMGKDPHLRIEFRALPAGPSNLDMIANLALLVGLTVGLSHNIDSYINKLPFEYAEFNFYRAAQQGLKANILWPQQHQHQLTERKLSDVVADLLPTASAGLQELGVAADDIKLYLGIIERRLAAQQTGAIWQLTALDTLTNTMNQEAALKELIKQYTLNNIANLPVADWDPVK